MADEAPKGPEKGPMFELKLIGRLNAGQAVSKPQQSSPHIEARREDQETGRRLANEYAKEALLTQVHLMRTSTDENVIMRASKEIMNRAWGQTKALTEEEKKGADAGSILDVLAAVSSHMSAIEQTPPEAAAIEHQPETTEDSLEKLLDDLNTEDAELIND
jgi:hypothetical protein